MRSFTLLILLFTISQSLVSQNPGNIDYAALPDGLYKTKKDLLAGKPSSTEKVKFRFYNPGPDSLNIPPDRCYFNYESTGKKVRKMLAVKFWGELYFQTGSMVLPKNRNKKDDAQTALSLPALYEFNRVTAFSDKYAYFEAALKSMWEQGLMDNLSVSTGTPYDDIGLGFNKSVVWDYEKQEFNIFRNCKDYNRFMEANNPVAVQDCTGKNYDRNIARKAVLDIK